MFDGAAQLAPAARARSAAIPDALWREALESLPFVAIYTDEELARLRAKVVLFLSAKSIVGARGHEVTPLQRVIIARPGLRARAEPRHGLLRRLGERHRLSRRVHSGLGIRGRSGCRAPQRRTARRRGHARRPGRAVVARRRGVGRLGLGRDEPRDSRVRAQARHAQRRGQRLPAAARDDAAAHLEEDADRGLRAFPHARRARRSHGHRPVCRRVAGRVLRRALRSFLRRSRHCCCTSTRRSTSSSCGSTSRTRRRGRSCCSTNSDERSTIRAGGFPPRSVLPSMRFGAHRLRSHRSCESVRRWPRSSSWSPS